MLTCSGYGKRPVTLKVLFPREWRRGHHEVKYGQDDTFAYVRLPNGYAIGIAGALVAGEPYAGYVRLTPKEEAKIVWQTTPTEKWKPKDKPTATFSFIEFDFVKTHNQKLLEAK